MESSAEMIYLDHGRKPVAMPAKGRFLAERTFETCLPGDEVR